MSAVQHFLSDQLALARQMHHQGVRSSPKLKATSRLDTDSGNPLRGPGGMVGVFQFYESIHAPGALALGFDITTLEGNLGYAKHVYNTQGLTPWNSSRWCWDVPTVAPAPAATLATPITPAPALSAHTVTNRAALQEQILTLTKLIALLQKQLALKSVTSLS